MRRAAWLGMVLLVAAAGRAQPADPAAGMVRAVVTAEVTGVDGGAPGAAVVVRAGGTTRFFNFGLADRRRQRPVTPDSIFELASVTKVFTTTLLALAVQNGGVKLTDSAAIGLPVLEAGGDIRKVSLEELATHTSGLPRVPPRQGHPYTEAEMLACLQGWHRSDPPGPHFLYSNLGVGLLGLDLAARVRRPLMELYTEEILKPLGMRSTFLVIPPEAQDRLVQGYARRGDRPVPRTPVRAWAAAGSLCASARDMAAFLAASMNEGDAPAELRSAMREAQQGRFRVNARFVQALGWQVMDLGGGLTAVDKNGALRATSTYIGFLPGKGIGVVILANRGGVRVTRAGREILRRLARPQP